MRRPALPLLALTACVEADKIGNEDYLPLDDGAGVEGADGSPGGGDAGDGGVGTGSLDFAQVTAEGGCLDEPEASAPVSLTWAEVDGVPTCQHAPVALPACGPVTVDLEIDPEARTLLAAYTAGDCASTCAWGLSWPLPEDLEPGTWSVTAGPDAASFELD